MPAELAGFDLFMRHTDVNGKTTVQMHRTWDKARSIASREDDAARENSKQKPDEPRLAKVEQITEDQYQKERGRK